MLQRSKQTHVLNKKESQCCRKHSQDAMYQSQGATRQQALCHLVLLKRLAGTSSGNKYLHSDNLKQGCCRSSCTDKYVSLQTGTTQATFAGKHGTLLLTQCSKRFQTDGGKINNVDHKEHMLLSRCPKHASFSQARCQQQLAGQYVQLDIQPGSLIV